MLITKTITSTSNPEIKRLMLLNTQSRQRRKESLFCIEGFRLLDDAVKSGIKIEKLYFTSDALEKHGHKVEGFVSCADEACEVSGNVMAHLSETETPQGVFGVCKMRTDLLSEGDIARGGKYVLLENIQDPSNIGAVARSAEALGISGLIVCGGCDIYSPKSLRASMGAFFRIPIMLCDNPTELVLSLKREGVSFFACVPDRCAQDVRQLRFDSPCVAVIGNEGNGISEELKCASGAMLTIPMPGRAESLNAAAAAAIVMWEMMRNGK